MEIVNVNGREYDLDALKKFMDADLCREVYSSCPGCDNQEFVDVYCRLYLDRFGEEFSVKNVIKRSLLASFGR